MTNKNTLVELINCYSKPNLENYSTNQLIFILEQYLENNNQNNNIIIQDIKNKSKDELDEIIIDIWKNNFIKDNYDNTIDCSICLQPVNNSNIISLECNHIYHSSCLINYIHCNVIEMFDNYTNQNSNLFSQIDKINKIFRCPKCRIHMTKMIQDKKYDNECTQNNINDVNLENHNHGEYIYNNYYNNNDNNGYNNDNNDIDNINIGIDLLSGLWTNTFSLSNTNNQFNQNNQFNISNIYDNISLCDNFKLELDSISDDEFYEYISSSDDSSDD